jgi:hypothetical protein
MPDLPEVYTAPPTPPDEPEPPRFPWEEHPAFRFTFLLHFTQPGDRAALEHLGGMLYDMALELSKSWPAWRESTTRAEMRAVARDLQHAESFLRSVADERRTVSLDYDSERWTLMAETWAEMVGRIGKGIEDMLGPLYDREGNRL